MIEYIRRQYYEQLNYQSKSKENLLEVSLYVVISILGIICLIIWDQSSKTYCKVISGVILLVVFSIMIIVNKKSEKIYYKNTSRIENKVDILYNVLKKEGYSSLNSVNLLIDSCNFKIQDKRPSEKILKPIKDVFSIVIMPIVTYFIGFYNEKLMKISPEALKVFMKNSGKFFILGIIFVVIIITLFCFFHFPSVDILNSKYNDYFKIRELLNDVKLKYYNDINDQKSDDKQTIIDGKNKIKVKVKKLKKL